MPSTWVVVAVAAAAVAAIVVTAVLVSRSPQPTTAAPTAAPTTEPETPEPTLRPTPEPTPEPTLRPVPTPEPTLRPVPTTRPTLRPVPTPEPTLRPVPTTRPTLRPTPAPCTLPLETGKCVARHLRYGFDAKVGACRQFTYGGCDGNANNFRTEADCQRACPGRISKPPPSGNPACALPLVTGMCRAAFKRYAYDPKAGKCTAFTYGGCGGNANNFASETECQRACLAQPPKAPPSGNPACALPPGQSGPCAAALPRFTFRDGKCTRFEYGGCGGNANNFASEGECHNACLAPTFKAPPSGNPACALPLVGGMCKNVGMPKFGFDTATGRCREFSYHCLGNANRFDSEAECRRACVTGTKTPAKTPKVSATCALPLVTGMCRAAFKRYGFDAKAGTCRRFTYGGCGGNANNFGSEAECARACPPAAR